MDSKGSGADSYNPNTLLNDSLHSHGILLKDKATVFEGGQIRRTDINIPAEFSCCSYSFCPYKPFIFCASNGIDMGSDLKVKARF